MRNPFVIIERGFYTLREVVWNYPDTLASINSWFGRLYMLSRPFSHFASAILISALVLLIVLPVGIVSSFFNSESKFVEAVVVGQDAAGNVQQLSRVNPLLPTSIQLEKDLSELIYEPLIRYEQDGKITPVLAESIIRVQEGAEYEFNLRPNVYWHDGVEFSVADVERSLEIISELDSRFDDNSYVLAVKQMAWERTGEHSIRICTTNESLLSRLSPEDQDRKCTGVSGEKPILSNFLELVSVKVIPAHLSSDINSLTIDTPEPLLNRLPVGTGPYRFGGTDVNSIFLSRNRDYHGEVAGIDNLEFKLYGTIDKAIAAVQKSEVHALAVSSTEHLQKMSEYGQVNTLLSSVLSNQYWAIYFNLRKDLNGNPLGPSFMQDVNVRRGLSSAINRDRILRTLLDTGTEAYGPIYPENEYFNKKTKRFGYSENAANKFLNRAGWLLNIDTGWREKNGVRMQFAISFIDTYDRAKVVESIRQDLAQVGVELVPDPRSIEELTGQVVTTKLFDSLLYGVSTFVDPDRYELFHSDETLNLSSYTGSEQTVQIKNKKTVRVPRVDKLLEQGRSYDPLEAKRQRKEVYNQVQDLVAADAPVVFLYHPQYIYYVNSRVLGVDLSDSTNLEERFRYISNWSLI